MLCHTRWVYWAVFRANTLINPFIAKINHNELLTFPNQSDQVMFGSVEQAWVWGRRTTIYFGSGNQPARFRPLPRP